MENIKEFLSATSIWENTNQDILTFIISILLGLVFQGIISKHLSHYLYKIIGKQEKRVGQEKELRPAEKTFQQIERKSLK